MLVSSSRSVVGPLTSSATSPGAHHVHHIAAADLSPRSSNSSMVSSNESLLNTSLSVPSPGIRESGGSPIREGGEISALQCLQNAFKRSPFYLRDNENEQLEQHFSQTYPILNSPVVGALFNSPHMKSESDESQDELHDGDNEMSNRHHDGLARVESPSSTSPISPDDYNNAIANIFQCPLCAVAYNSRHDFNEHLVTHSAQHACPKCTFIASSDEELRAHVQDVHGVDDFLDILSDDEVKTPKTNAQGKIKTFKCKHCEHRSVTKKEFWDHTKSHIRQEKMLHCPKCPFITEYKHHLEYHLRNHMGSKPYQCTKCAYSCVNKSMLNSHLKSHSTIYQYRCSDCSYATKYCHSLKLHLRKYNHNPAMVLNPDGTPNPLPIIDVYGTRRGPKMKRPDPILEGLATTQPLMPQSSPSGNYTGPSNKASKMLKKTPVKKAKAEQPRQQQLDARDLSPKPASSPRFTSSMPSQSATPPLHKMNKEDSSGDSDSEMRTTGLSFPMQNGKGRAPQLPQAPISPDSIAMILQRSNGLRDHPQLKDLNAFTQPHEIFAAFNQYLPLLNPMFQIPSTPNEQQTTFLAQLLQSRMTPAQQQLQNLMKMNITNNNTLPNVAAALLPVAPSPLDLRNPKNDMGSFGNNEEIKRRKRKGKALRYERKYCSDEDDEDDDEAIDFSNNNKLMIKANADKKRKWEVPTDLSVSSSNMLCKYCEISFPDRELYMIHMSYHSGDMDPFLCRCGKKTQNKVEFFRHLNADPH